MVGVNCPPYRAPEPDVFDGGGTQIAIEPGPQPKADPPLVVLLGGVSGVGKTTIGNLLVRDLGLSHHISTGFIRSAITHLLDEPDARLLGKHTYDAYEAMPDSGNGSRSPLLEGAARQAGILKPSIEACIRRALREGIGMVLEGSHFIPGVLDPAELGGTVMCILDVPDREALKCRALSPNHSRRRLSDDQLARLIQLQDQILDLARSHGQSVIVNEDMHQTLEQIKSLAAVQTELARR